MNNREQDYQEALDKIYSYVANSRVRQIGKPHKEFSLDRIRALLAELNNPHNQYPVIHVAGTKGKGSTAAMIANVFRSAGYSVGLYTSPHLQDYCERIQVNGIPIAHSELVGLVEKLEPYFQQYQEITTFEVTTALGFQYFNEKKVDIAIIEVGLGGRLDATNVVTPLVSVITSISLDHTDILGDTLEKVAFEKAGIIKEDRPVVVSKQRGNVYPVLKRIAAERNASLHVAPENYPLKVIRMDPTGMTVSLNNDSSTEEIHLPLLGEYQLENLQSAITAINICREIGWNISWQDMITGIEGVSWPARFEILNSLPTIIIDAAHNPYSVQRLVDSVHKVFPEKNIIAIFGASKGKDVRGMLEQLLPECEHVVMSRSIHPRAINPQELVKLAVEIGYEAESIIPAEEALATSLGLCDDDSLILVAGSVFIAAAVRNIWEQRSN